MECNREEAVRARKIAEDKLKDKDFAGARKFALTAQNLYPNLEGLAQMFIILKVYEAAENKIGGESDWYGVLGVTPTADDEQIRKQYRRLALVLQPDKNKCASADGALKLLSEAWTLLSDKSKRLHYNLRRSSRGFNLQVPTQNVRPPTAPPPNGFHTFTTSVASPRTDNEKDKNTPPPLPPPSLKRTDTFWTICYQCKKHYEYLKHYLNSTLFCRNCHSAFIAKEMTPPSNIPKSSDWCALPRAAGDNPHDAGRKVAPATQNPPAGAKLSNPPISPWGFQQSSGKYTVATRAAGLIQPANEKMKRVHEDSMSAGGPAKKKRDDERPLYGGRVSYQMAAGGNNGAPPLFNDLSGFSVNSKPNSTKELTPLELRNMLMNKAQTEIRKKLTSWRTEKETERAKEGSKGPKGKNPMGDAAKMKVKEETKAYKNAMDKNTKEKVKVQSMGKEGNTGEAKKGILSTEKTAKEKESEQVLSMNVPDPDFRDFDQDRVENSFQDNQVWVAYDNDDGMPRFYAMIHKVVTRKPFRVKMSWLNSKSTAEFGELNWVGSGFYKTCGEFNVGRHEFNKSLNSFSHPVKWTKAPRGRIHIFPKKGDVWALYRNWSTDWNASTPDEDIHKYDMVKVLEDYNQEKGVLVIPLVKVAGFKTVFRPDSDEKKVKQIPNNEMFRFSHQVPSYILTGEEGVNAPKGCLELDPAATPLELLQVISDEAVLNDQNMQKEEAAS